MSPLSFELTDEEAEIAGARAAWRLWLAGGLRKRHIAPLAVFALAIAIISALGLTGAVSRRVAEISLILSAATFMAVQLWTRRGLAGARRRGAALAGELRGPVRLTLDDEGFTKEAARRVTLRFVDGLEVESTGDLNYVWPRSGAPLVWPRRAHATPDDADAFLAYARARAELSRTPALDCSHTARRIKPFSPQGVEDARPRTGFGGRRSPKGG